MNSSCVEGGFAGVGVLSDDPLFVDLAGGDLRLTDLSPCRDVGDEFLLPADPGDLDGDGLRFEALPLDRDGSPRVVGPGLDLGAYELPAGSGNDLIRGDCNGDAMFNIGDPIAHLGALFAGGAQPTCDDACDANDDGALDLADPIYALAALFSGGPFPLAPHPDCGLDPTADALDSASTAGCP